MVEIRKDADLGIKVILFLSLLFNFVYAIFLFVVGLVYYSEWFFIMSIYYGLLAVARILIFFQIKRKKSIRKQIVVMRVCGCYLFLLNVVVAVMMFLLIYSAQQVRHHEITVIALATYTFSSLTIAIIGSIKYFRRNEHLYSCAKVISLISASVSMVTLTDTMISTFGGEEGVLRAVTLPLLSVFVSAFIIVCAIMMIKKANIDLRKFKNEQNGK